MVVEYDGCAMDYSSVGGNTVQQPMSRCVLIKERIKTRSDIIVANRMGEGVLASAYAIVAVSSIINA